MNMYVKNAKMATPNVESRSVGIQNKNVFKSVFTIWLAAKNKAVNKSARIQNTGERIIATRTPSPVAFCSLRPLKSSGARITTQARTIAANPLRMALT